MNPDRSLREQFERLMHAYGPALRRFCSAHRSDPGDRQDLFQEIALALWTALPRFRGDASERTWIHRIAQNVAFSDAKRQRRVREREVPFENDPAAGSAESERRRELFDAVRRLDPVERQLAILHLEGLTARKSARRLGSRKATRLCA